MLHKMRRRSSEPIPSLDSFDVKPTKQRRLSHDNYDVLPVKTSIIRQHTSLPLLHDFAFLYGINTTAHKEYAMGKYPWENTSITPKNLADMVKKKQVVKIGKLPSFEFKEVDVLGMSNDKRMFFNYISEVDETTIKKNGKQLMRDVDGTRNKFLKPHVSSMLYKIFVHDKNWSARYPEYTQGHDRMINDWQIKISVQDTIHSIRWMLLAQDYVDGSNLRSTTYLGRISPFETTDVLTPPILPLFDMLNELVNNLSRPDLVYEVAVQLKQFYEKNDFKKVRKFIMGKPNIIEGLRDFLKKYDTSPMITESPDLLLLFRGSTHD